MVGRPGESVGRTRAEVKGSRSLLQRKRSALTWHNITSMPTLDTPTPRASLNRLELELITRARDGMAVHDGSHREAAAGKRLVASGIFAARRFGATHRETGSVLCWVLTPTARRLFA